MRLPDPYTPPESPEPRPEEPAADLPASGTLRGTRGPAILELLASEGKPVQRSEIRRRLDLGEAQLSHLLSDLEEAELVRRIKPAKGREVLVELGPAGREVVKVEILPGWVEVFLSEMSAMRSGWRTKPEILAAELERAGAPSRLAAERISGALAALATPAVPRGGEDDDSEGDPGSALETRFELRKEQWEMLEKTALQRGVGTTASNVLQEAVDSYFDHQEDRKALVREALSVLGTLDDAAAGEMEETVRQLRSSWR
jgi:DNA-binding MarR family transcriptional regulator